MSRYRKHKYEKDDDVIYVTLNANSSTSIANNQQLARLEIQQSFYFFYKYRMTTLRGGRRRKIMMEGNQISPENQQGKIFLFLTI